MLKPTPRKPQPSAPFLHNRKVQVAGIIGLLVVAGGVWGFTSIGRKPKSALPKELSVAALKAAANDPRQMHERIHQAMSQPGMTDAQREELGHNMREVFEARMDERVNEYFTAGEADRKSVLDKHIDEWQRMRGQWERERQARGDRRPPGAGGPPGRGPNAAAPGTGGANPGGVSTGAPNASNDPGRGGPGGHRGGGGPTRAERKARSESRNPDQTARRMAYFSALQQRAGQRGVQMGWGGPGGGGPGGPGGGGPGGRRGS